MKNVILGLLVCCAFLSNTAFGQSDVFMLFGIGTESKAAAGAGQIASRNAPANYYNPANMAVQTNEIDPYVSLDFNSLNYSFQRPEYEEVAAKQIVPIPFFGLVYKPSSLKKLVIGSSVLPIPAGAGKQEIEKLPLTVVEDGEPEILDVTSEGKAVGYRASLGAAYEVTDGLIIGISMLQSASDQSIAAKAQGTDKISLKSDTKTRTNSAILGIRGQTLQGRLTGAFTIRPKATIASSTLTELPRVNPPAKLESNRQSHGPLGIGAAAEARIWQGLSPFIEILIEKWSELRSEPRVSGIIEGSPDFFDTTDIIIGTSYTKSRQKFVLGYGIYQSQLGQGILKSESADDKALIGHEFANIDAMPHFAYSLGYIRSFPLAQLTTALSYKAGQREVWEKAKGFGTYQLTILTLSIGMTYQL